MKTVLPIVIYFIASLAHAQHLPLQNYTTRDGLISNFVTEIYQDSRGYLWLGTDEGISIFDGYRFRNITFDESKVWGDINTIIESKFYPGKMWIATNGGGLVQYLHGQMTNFLVENNETSNKVNSVLEMDDSSLWLATDNGLYHFQNGSVSRTDMIRMVGVFRLVRDLSGIIWCFNGQQVFLFSPEHKTLIVPNIKDLPKSNLYIVNALPDSSIAIIGKGVPRETLYIIKNFSIQRKIDIGSLNATSTILDQQKRYWVRTSKGLIMIHGTMQGSVSHLYNESNGLPSNETTVGYTDREHNIWFGTLGRGLVKMNSIESYQLSFEELSGRGTIDRYSHLWVPSLLGLYEVWRDTTMMWQSHLHLLNSAQGKNIKFMAASVDTNQNIWISDNQGSLHYVTITQLPTGHSRLALKYSLTSEKGFPRSLGITMMIDSKNMLWYGLDSAGGLACIDFASTPTIAALYKHKDNFPIRDVRELYEDQSGNIWVMGYESAYWIVKRIPNGFMIDSVSSLATMLPKIPFRSVLQTNNGLLWFGSRYSGLYRYDGKVLRHFTKKDGMISNQIWSLAETSAGGLIIGTQGGLMYMPDSTATRFISLQQYTPSPVRKAGSAKDFSFALTRFDLTLFSTPVDGTSSKFPEVYFASLKINGKEHSLADNISLSSNENTVTIDYTAISFRNTGALRFQYKLSPIEDRWSEATMGRSVTYANLSSGKYVFVVRALNQEGKPNEAPSILPFAIASPLWARWWFIALCGLVIAGVFVIVERFRVQRLLEMEKIRSRIAADLHDDIGSGLTRIALLTEMIHRQSVSGEKVPDEQFTIPSFTEKIGTISRELIDAMGDVVWSVDPKNNSMEKLLHRVQTFATEVCEAKDIALVFHAENGIEKIKVASDSIRAILLVAKEALTNAVRHSNAKTVTVSLKRSNNHLAIEIKDDGGGFALNELSRTNGLTNMRNRIEKNGGIFTIEAVKGKGTVIFAVIPLQHHN